MAIKKNTIDKMMTSNDQDWATPWWVIKGLEKKFGIKFELDVCTYPHTAKAPEFFTEDDDALSKNWDKKVCWMNPPYGQVIPTWLTYAADQADKHKNKIFALVPARPDTQWFHNIATRGKIYFLKGRIPFVRPGEKDEEAKPGAFPSMIIVFGEKPGMDTLDTKELRKLAKDN